MNARPSGVDGDDPDARNDKQSVVADALSIL